MIIDTHSHYDDEVFDCDRHFLLNSMNQNGVDKIITIGTNLKTCKSACGLADDFDCVYAAVGIHPCECHNLPLDYIDTLENLAKHKKVVAIGEIGLDYHYDDNPKKEVQAKVFSEQLKLASKLDLPVSIHTRDATEDTLKILEKHDVKGVMHCFSGSLETAKIVTKLGLFLGIGGVLTFSNAKTLKKVVTEIPLTSLVLETDCPYLAPVPFRGQRNDSTKISFVVDEIVRLKQENGENITKDEVIAITNKNAHKIFNKMQ